MSDPRKNSRDVFPPTGTELNAKSWLTEAPMRMLMNNLHPDVAENPHELVVYGGIGRAARTWKDFDQIVASLKDLEDDETLMSRMRRVSCSRTQTWFRIGPLGITLASWIKRASLCMVR